MNYQSVYDTLELEVGPVTNTSKILLVCTETFLFEPYRKLFLSSMEDRCLQLTSQEENQVDVY